MGVQILIESSGRATPFLTFVAVAAAHVDGAAMMISRRRCRDVAMAPPMMHDSLRASHSSRE